MKPKFKISDYATMPFGLPLVVYILNFHTINEIGIYGYSEPSQTAEQNDNTVAIWKVKPKPCQTPS